MTDYRVTFRAMPSTVPAINRLRRLLKLALRYLRLSAVNVEAGVDGVFPRQSNAKAREGLAPPPPPSRQTCAQPGGAVVLKWRGDRYFTAPLPPVRVKEPRIFRPHDAPTVDLYY